MVSPDLVRTMRGRRVSVELSQAGGGAVIEGTLVSCLESADGLVAYVADGSGRTHTIHYQHIEELRSLDAGPGA